MRVSKQFELSSFGMHIEVTEYLLHAIVSKLIFPRHGLDYPRLRTKISFSLVSPSPPIFNFPSAQQLPYPLPFLLFSHPPNLYFNCFPGSNFITYLPYTTPFSSIGPPILHHFLFFYLILIILGVVIIWSSPSKLLWQRDLNLSIPESNLTPDFAHCFSDFPSFLDSLSLGKFQSSCISHMAASNSGKFHGSYSWALPNHTNCGVAVARQLAQHHASHCQTWASCTKYMEMCYCG